VTGGSRGLGRELARALLARGFAVAIVARGREALATAERELARGAPGRVAAWPCDVGDAAQCREAVERVVETFGRLDLLANCAGTIGVAPIERQARADFEASLAVHLYGPLALMIAARDALVRAGRGRIVNVAAIEGLIGVPRLAATVAGKFALVGVSQSLAAEWRGLGIRVTLVCPGFIRPPRSEAGGAPATPMPRWVALAARSSLASIGRERAARRILAASDRGQARLVLTPLARVLFLWGALAPGSLARFAAWADRRAWRGAADPGNTHAAG